MTIEKHGTRAGSAKKAYRDATGINPTTCRLAHSFCPACYDYFAQKIQAA